MKRPTALILVLVAPLAAGCIGASEPAQESVAAAAPAAALTAPLEAPHVETAIWRGHVLLGAAADIPAHWDPPERHLKKLMNEGFSVHIGENVTALEFRLEWEGAPGSRLLFMSHSPHDQGVRMREYQTSSFGSEAREQCFRIPAADLAEIPAGHWHPMFHPEPAAANVRATITVSAIGTVPMIEPHPHGHDPTVPDEVAGPVLAYADPDSHDPCNGPLGGPAGEA